MIMHVRLCLAADVNLSLKADNLSSESLFCSVSPEGLHVSAIRIWSDVGVWHVVGQYPTMDNLQPSPVSIDMMNKCGIVDATRSHIAKSLGAGARTSLQLACSSVCSVPWSGVAGRSRHM